jgi:GWxTD domain-containing protein
MKKQISSLILLLFLCIGGANAQELHALFDVKKFYIPEQGPFIETYLSLSAPTLHYKTNENGAVQANVEITQIIKQGDEIKDFKKHNLAGPEITDSILADFMDQQRFALKNGEYELEVQMVDLNSDDKKPYITKQNIDINFPESGIFISDIELLESIKKAETPSELTKGGYDVVPLTNNYFPPSIEKVAFYVEIYNKSGEKALAADDKFLVTYYIESQRPEKKLSSYSKLGKKTANPVNVVIDAFDIVKLGSGNYNLVVEARDRENNLLAQQKMFFQRNNPFANVNMSEIGQTNIENTFAAQIENEDSITEYINCLRPIAGDVERGMMDRQLTMASIDIKQKFFYNFWKARNSDEPAAEWASYKIQVDKVDQLFSTKIKEGYETDRGRIYLKYGAPNQVTDRPNEPSAYPYQIWQYYKLGKFNNKKFIFYQPDLVTNDYEVLHSDLPGERKNYRWEYVLNKRNTPAGDLDSETEGHFNHYGGGATDFFNNPR